MQELGATFNSAVTASAQESQNKSQSPVIPPRPTLGPLANPTPGTPTPAALSATPSSAANGPGAATPSGPQAGGGQGLNATSFLRPGPSPLGPSHLGPSAQPMVQAKAMPPSSFAVSGTVLTKRLPVQNCWHSLHI